MKSNPQRLMNDPEFGAALKAAAADGLGPDRLAASGQALEQALVGLDGAAVASPLALKVVAAGALLAAVGASLWVYNQPEPHQPVATVVPVVVNATPTPTAARIALSTPEATPQLLAVAPTVTAAVIPQVTVEPTPVVLDISSLSDQIVMYDQAKSYAGQQDYDRATATLEKLLETWPATPLKAEVQLSRADYLTRSGRYSEATQYVNAMLVDPAHAGRTNELLRLLGDLWLKQDNCPQAVAAYEAVVANGGPMDESIHRGLARCSIE